MGTLPEPLRLAAERIVREYGPRGRITYSQLDAIVSLGEFASAYLDVFFDMLIEKGVRVVPDGSRR
jgi:hypothetical protein